MQCPSCKADLVFDGTYWERYCPKCGLVVEEQMIDWKSGYSFDPADALAAWVAAHGATSPVYLFKNLGSSATMGMAARYEKVEASYMRAYPYFTSMWGAVRMPMHARIDSAIMYRKCARLGLTKGRSTPLVVGAIGLISMPAYMSWRGAAAWLIDMEVDIDRLAACGMLIMKELNLKSYPFRIRTRRLIRDGVMRLGLNSRVTDKALIALDEMLKNKSMGRRRESTLAAMAVYRAAGELGIKVRQKEIAGVFRVSERGLRQRKRVRGRTIQRLNK